jgi:dynein heavy chain, axonemal
VSQLLNTILETQPKQSSASGGRTREDIVQDKCEELLATIPEDYREDVYLEQIGAMGGLEVPLNIFLMQEVQRLQTVIEKVGVCEEAEALLTMQLAGA